MKKNQKKLSILIAELLAIILAGCHNYYKAMQTHIDSTPRTATVIDSLQNKNKYFVLRSSSNAYHISKLSLSDDKANFAMTLDSLQEEHRLHLKKGHRNANMQYKLKTPETSVLNEVHLYIKENEPAKSGNYTLSLDQVQKIEIIQKDKGRTTSSYVIGAIGFTAGLFVVVVAIIGITGGFTISP